MTDVQTASLVIGAETILSTEFGDFTLRIYNNEEGEEYSVLFQGDVSEDSELLVRVHDACITGETFHSLHCECRQQLEKSMDLVAKKGAGMIIYLPQEGRGIGLTNKVKAYALQRKGFDTVEANKELHLPIDNRTYDAAAAILEDMNVSSFHLLTNSPQKIEALSQFGFTVTREPLEIPSTKTTKKYLQTKKEKMNHLLSSL